MHAKMKPVSIVPPHSTATTYVSIAVFAWNEEEGIAATLRSLLEQSIFARLARRGCQSELICVANGCTDRTAAVAEEVFALHRQQCAAAGGILARAVNLADRGKVNAWNQFVHRLSAREARYLFMMDADILIHRPQSLWNMLRALEKEREANIAVDRPCKHMEFKARKNWGERLSLAASRMTLAAPGQLCGQLYCIRTGIARKIHLPKDLAACEDGFIKALVCSDFLSHASVPERIRVVKGAEHTFEAYTSPRAILKNQKRQIMGQTLVHLLIDKELPRLTSSQRRHLAETLRAMDANDPGWLKRRLGTHMRQVRFFWSLYPGMLGQRFRQLKRLGFGKRIRSLPAAVASSAMVLVSSFLAFRALKAGCTDYWPRARRVGFEGGQLPGLTERLSPETSPIHSH